MRYVLIPTKLDKIAKDILTAKGYTVVQDGETDLASLVQQHPETEALIVRSEKITSEIIDALPKLKTVVRAGAGYNTIDIKHARRNNVDVMNTPGANANGVAEEVFAMALAAYRHVIPADIDTRKGGWEKKKFMGRELTGKTLGIVGLGNIGQLVAKHSFGFDMKVLAYDPVVSESKAQEVGAKLVSLELLFSEADIITLHIPENDETRGMINKRLLSLVKKGAMLINCARAGIVNEDDIRALKAEKELLFCTDVFPADEPGPKSVADIADVMLPHLGANTKEANFTAAKRAAEQLVAYFESGVNTYVVNKGIPDDLNENYQQLAYRLALIARCYIGRGTPVRQVRCSFYGDLSKFAKWFYSPICAALSEHFEFQQDPEEALRYLQEKGIGFELRSADESKRYGNSMTIDLESGAKVVSIRGTIAENNLMVSRLNDFDRVYFVPRGNAFIVEYCDRPGVLSMITRACGDANINIDDIHAPRDSEAKHAIAILKTSVPVPQEIVEAVAKEVDAKVAFTVNLP